MITSIVKGLRDPPLVLQNKKRRAVHGWKTGSKGKTGEPGGSHAQPAKGIIGHKKSAL